MSEKRAGKTSTKKTATKASNKSSSRGAKKSRSNKKSKTSGKGKSAKIPTRDKPSKNGSMSILDEGLDVFHVDKYLRSYNNGDSSKRNKEPVPKGNTWTERAQRQRANRGFASRWSRSRSMLPETKGEATYSDYVYSTSETESGSTHLSLHMVSSSAGGPRKRKPSTGKARDLSDRGRSDRTRGDSTGGDRKRSRKDNSDRPDKRGAKSSERGAKSSERGAKSSDRGAKSSGKSDRGRRDRSDTRSGFARAKGSTGSTGGKSDRKSETSIRKSDSWSSSSGERKLDNTITRGSLSIFSSGSSDRIISVKGSDLTGDDRKRSRMGSTKGKK